MPRQVLVALLVLSAGLAGCTADRQPVCEPAHDPDNGTGVCFATRDGWVLQGHEWNPNSTTSVLLVHGLEETHAQYHDLAEILAEDGYRVLAMDTRGHGKSTNLTAGGERTVDSFRNRDLYHALRDLNASQRYLGHAPEVIVGASVGANQALVHAANNPNVTGVALLSPSMGQGALDAREPNRDYEGSILYMASREDRRAAKAVDRLSANHTGPERVEPFLGKGHGTQMLDNQTRPLIANWTRNVTSP